MAYFQLRQYFIKPGKRAEAIIVMEEVLLPYVIAKGSVVTGRFMVKADEGEYYAWLPRYESEAEQERVENAIRGEDRWGSEIFPALTEVFDFSKAAIIRLDALPTSILR